MTFVEFTKRASHAMGLHISRWPTNDARRTKKYPLLSFSTGLIEHYDIQFNVLDAGAGGRLDDFTQVIISALPKGRLKIRGFEVDVDDCNRMNAEARSANSPNHYYPLGLWSTSGRQTVHFTAEPDGSSLFPPNEKLVNRWRYSDGKNLGDMLTVKRQMPINVTSIDQWRKDENIPSLDFIKLNVQAAELEILHGAESSLSDVLGLQVEMAFQQSYTGAPFFSDIDPVLRRHGFVFFDLLTINLVGRVASKIAFPIIAWHQPRRAPQNPPPVDGSNSPT